MTVIEKIKDILRPTPLYKPFLLRKALQQERKYLRVRDSYYQENPEIFSHPGYLERSKKLLRKNWGGPEEKKGVLKDIHIFTIDRPGLRSIWFQSELNRNFKLSVFSITRHKLGFDQGEKDLVTHSTGIDDRDRFRPSISLGKNWRLWRSKLQLDILEAICEAHRKDPIDLCLAYGSYTEFEPETLNKIRKMGIPVALLWLDEKHAFWEKPLGIPNGQKPLIGSCDIHLTNSFECVRWYMAEGAAAYYFPQAIDPEIYKPLDVKKDIPVSFMGAAYGPRFDFICSLRKTGVPIQCFGAGWETPEENSNLNNIEIYCRSVINLGIGATGHSERLTCVKGRDFEVPAVGGFYLTTYDYELSRLFNIGKEIVCYRNVFDCIELIRYYLERPEVAQEIGKAGRRRILSEHTWTHRLVGLLQWMGILSRKE